MTTAEAIDEITDTAQFEILAIRALRELEADCRAIIHLGVNPEGKTVPGPLDGFCLVPGSRPHRYVFAAATVTGPENLRTKWLFDHRASKRKDASEKDDGDLIKAATEAASLRASGPTAEFVVYLCTNRLPGKDLITEAISTGLGRQVEVRILEQSRLRDFLDTTPQGQWLRQEHLGIDADLVSHELLHTLARQSLKSYLAEIMITPKGGVVQTKVASEACKEIETPSVIHVLLGASGAGKSMVAHTILRSHIERGHVGFWIPADAAESALSLSEAVERVLRSLHPKLAVGAGASALAIGTNDEPLILVVDDINRSKGPAGILTKILGWARPAPQPQKSDAEVLSPIRLVCPLWNSYWLPKQDRYEQVPWLRVHLVGPMQRSESIACLKEALGTPASQFTEGELDQLAERMGDDAILLGLFGTILQENQSQDPGVIAADVIGSFIRACLGELAAENRVTAEDYNSAAVHLASEMIRRRALYPKWSDVELWFAGNHRRMTALSQLSQCPLCRITQRQANAHFEFRHDRILEHFLSTAAARLLESEADRPILADPYFIPFVARAVAQHEFSDEILDWIRNELPTSLVASIPFLSPNEPQYSGRVRSRAREWLLDIDGALPAIRRDALDILTTTRSPAVLELTVGLSESEPVWLARLRNGDALAGAKALANRFDPAIRHNMLEALINEAALRHGKELVSQLNSALRSESLGDSLRAGALTLAGYLGDSSLSDAIKVAWNAAGDRGCILLPALWAALRCSCETPNSVLDAMIAALSELSDEGQFSERHNATEELMFTVRHGLSDYVLAYLVRLGTENESFRWIVVSLLHRTDHPIAIRFVASELARANEQAEKSGSFSFFAAQWRSQWERDYGGNSTGLSPRSLQELRSLWEASENPPYLKKYAFSVWARYAEDLPTLQSIPVDSPDFDTASWQRALRGDREVVPYVAEAASRNPHWFDVVPCIWCPEFHDVVDTALNELAAASPNNVWDNTHFFLALLLRDIPAGESWQLLSKRWSDLRRVPLFVQVALYLGTPESRALAAESIAEFGSSEELLRHVDHFFAFMDSRLSHKLTYAHLESLQPFIRQLPDSCLSSMIDFCQRQDHWPWALQHLKPECERRAKVALHEVGTQPPLIVRMTKGYFPSDLDLFSDLDEIEKQGERSSLLWFWLERFGERGDPADRPFSVLKQWLVQSPSPTRYGIAATALAIRGSRKDLQMLPSEPGNAETERLVEDAKYSVMRRSLD